MAGLARRNQFQKHLYNLRRTMRAMAEKISMCKDEEMMEALKLIIGTEQKLFQIEIGMLSKKFAIIPDNADTAFVTGNGLENFGAESPLSNKYIG